MRIYKLYWRAAFFLSLFSVSSADAQDGLPPLTHGLTEITRTVAAPPLRFENLDEEVIDLQDLKGKVVVVNFWATWCPPCRREMGSLESLFQATREQDAVVLAVNIGEDLETVFSFLGVVEPSPSFPMLLDQDGQSMQDWVIKGLPTTYIVDPRGNLAYRAVGGREFDHPEIVEKVIALARAFKG